MRALVTGGAGFIGSNFIRLWLEEDPEVEIINLDALTYAGVQATVDELDHNDRHEFVKGDIRDQDVVDALVEKVDLVVNFAAESMVDRSIKDGRVFLDTNIVGTDVLLDAALRNGIERFVHISTDEVYGSVGAGFADESYPLDPSSAYSASKAASDLLARSYFVTHGLPVVITRCTNNYGPYQFPEKVIPLFITNLLDGKSVPLYGDGSNERDWLHVQDHCAAVLEVMRRGEPGEIYNIGADNQLSNLALTRQILDVMGLPETLIEPVTDRPGHDLRYAVDSSKIRKLGWEPEIEFDEGLERTVDWYKQHEEWWRPLKGAER